jgi:hypothetical protein
VLYLDEFAFIVKELVLPSLSVGMVVIATYVAYRRNLFSDLRKKDSSDETRAPVIYGDGNVIHFTPSDLQKQLAYDPSKFDEYHRQSISQSRISFWFSMFFASMGFLIIATSVFTYSDKSGYLGVVAGTIIDVVSALFFYQSNKARQLMSEFFDRLRSDRKLEESLKLCESIDEPLMRNALKVRLSLFFSGLEAGDSVATEIIRLSSASARSDGNQ